jgi:hypothetical protein
MNLCAAIAKMKKMMISVELAKTMPPYYLFCCLFGVWQSIVCLLQFTGATMMNNDDTSTVQVVSLYYGKLGVHRQVSWLFCVDNSKLLKVIDRFY